MRLLTYLVFGGLFITWLVPAQQPPSDDVKLGDVTVSGWLRTRSESWNWFEGSGKNSGPYTFSESIFRLGFSQSKDHIDWKVEFAVPVLLGLPNNAVLAAPQGQLGFGGSYYAANANSANTAMIFPKQAYARFKYGQKLKQSFLLGRNEFLDGAEVVAKDPTLAVLKRDRISQRLIGNFGFSDVGRSFDGGIYSLDSGRTNITLFGARPTRGVFQVDGWGEVNTNIFYGALNQQLGTPTHSGELRLFAIGYNDFRNSVLKVDNRPLALRTADTGGINIATLGGHYIQAVKTSAGVVDLLLWGAIQGGSWGNLKQRADAYALEAGWQIPGLDILKPWLRGGYNYASGDKNASDGTHGTFFQMLPTARIYARFPFFNMMNNKDAFGELMLRPSKSLTLRTDFHSLALANKNDLWYSGAGVYQPWTFGFTVRPPNAQKSLAALWDISADYALNRHIGVGLYFAQAVGKSVIQRIYPASQLGELGYLEFNYRF